LRPANIGTSENLGAKRKRYPKIIFKKVIFY